MEPSALAAFLGTLLLLALAPGSTDVALVGRSLGSGVAAAMAMVGGIVVADCLFIAVAVSGWAALAGAAERALPLVYAAAGVTLLLLGLGHLRQRPVPSSQEPGATSSRASGFAAGLLLTLADPKAILGYMGLLPAFLSPGRVSVPDALALLGAAAVAVGGIKTGYVLLADRARALAQGSAVGRRLHLLAGGLLAGTGLFLLSRV